MLGIPESCGDRSLASPSEWLDPCGFVGFNLAATVVALRGRFGPPPRVGTAF